MAESITEGTLKQWLKQEGDHVEADEEVATIETDKVSDAILASRENRHKRSSLLQDKSSLTDLTLLSKFRSTSPSTHRKLVRSKSTWQQRRTPSLSVKTCSRSRLEEHQTEACHSK